METMMIKKYLILSGIIAFSLVPAVHSASLDTLDGVQINVMLTDTALPAFSFQPSPQVTIEGETAADAFTISAAHSQAIGKVGGEAYAMNDSVSGLYTLRFAADDTMPAITAADTSELTDYTAPKGAAADADADADADAG